MASSTNCGWRLWPGEATAQDWRKPGVYALVACNAYSTLLNKKSRILYIGEAGNLFTRLRHRRDDHKPNHHFLWYWTDAKSNDVLPAELKSLLSRLNRKFKPSIYGLTLDHEAEKNTWNTGRHKAPRKLLEELLLIRHFFDFGQFPPLNARIPSVKSIAECWDTWWGECQRNPGDWRLPDVMNCWDELKKK